MINRLPLEFRVPGSRRKSSNGVNGAAGGGVSNFIARRSTQFIIDHPVAAMGAALVTGLILARLVKK